MPSLELTLVTGRTWRQGATMEGPGKQSPEYEQEISYCLLDEEDMVKIGVNDDDTIKAECNSISVILRAKKSEHSPHQGVAFIPMGFYANILVNSDTTGTGMPSFKGIPITISPAPNEQVSSIKNLLKKHLGAKNK
ncbi:MAG: molybdopterin dinucleotide binding domain-containing protein [Candidatus Hodarchaeota archaeon]